LQTVSKRFDGFHVLFVSTSFVCLVTTYLSPSFRNPLRVLFYWSRQYHYNLQYQELIINLVSR
jgi:hypothetical protein